MANIKKYNPDSQNWETWASNSATGVYSDNPILLSEEENEITVEDALIRDREDIELMKKNISWLALHGGGGSGGGGGDYVEVTSSIDILDNNNNPTSEIIWKTNAKSVSYQINSSKASNKFNVTATLDGYTIYSETGVAQGVIRSININRIGAYSSSTKHVLRVSAVDSWDNVVSNQATINETAIKLNKVVETYTVNIDEITSGAALTLSYQSSIIGDYILYWGTASDLDVNADHRLGWKELSIRSTFAENVVIPYWGSIDYQRLLRSSDVRSGQTLTFYFILISTSDQSVKSDVLEIKSTVVSPREIAIQPISLSTEILEVTRISKASVMSCNFIAYLNSTSLTYNYTITANKLVQDETTGEWSVANSKVIIDNNSGLYGNVTIITYPGLPRDDFFDGGSTYRFDIYVRDRMDLSKYNTAYAYVEIQSASNNIIPLNVDDKKIFEFNVWGDSGLNDQTWIWTNINDSFNHASENKSVVTTMTLKNMGGKSTLEPTNCRLTNKAYGVINGTQLNGSPISWFPSDPNDSLSGLIPTVPQFTLSISYFNDFTPDDNRTIFNYGNYTPATSSTPGSGRGILINNHDFYIQIGPNSPLITGKIQDSIYHEIDIVFGRGNTSSDNNAIVEVYHNGVLLAINKNVPARDIFGLTSYNEMSIACNKRGNNLSQFTNIKLQSVALYAVALNPYQIVCNWINHLVTYQLDGNTLNTTLLNDKLRSNLITANNDGTYSCPIWNTDSFDTQNWINVDNGKLTPDGNLHNICPIPIIILDLSTNSNWTFERFKQSWSNSTQPAAENVPMYFFNAYGGSTILDGVFVIVKPQGTTSLAYAIKNLDIDFGENRLFWAKQSWFPERIYTLKADIVDSAHANNACIGNFVNTCAENTTLLGQTPPMQYFNNNKNTSEFNLPQTAVGENGVSIKHTLEGFPVLLLARFPKSDGTTVNQSLGIYSFNLGRSSYYNMGFKVLKQFRTTEGDIVSETALPPMLLGAPNEAEDVIDFDAQSWEGRDSFNCSSKTETTQSEIDAVSNGGYATSVNATMPVQLDGYFWSSYPNHIQHFWDNKYPGGANVSDFQALCRDLVSCPYTKGSSNIEIGAAPIYQYDWDGTKMIVAQDQSSNVATIQRLNKDTPPFNIPNARFYYVVSMLFGLVDSLGKNLNMRLWKNTHLNNVSPIWYTCFYDMDTAMGIDNVGAEIVKPDVLDEELYNDPELVRKFAYGTYTNEKMYTVRDNKLWGILDHSTFKDQYGASGGVGGGTAAKESLYAAVWNFIRSNYLKSADDFMNRYFNNQTEGIGELLYNQDFDVKYVGTPQSNYMYGDRKAFVRDWITKRIKFLDSYFGYLQKSGSEPYLEDINVEDCSYNNIIKIKHQSGQEYVPVVTNYPCIITTTIGGQASYNYYLPANTLTNIRVAHPGNASGIQTQINNSDLLLEIRDLARLSVQAFEPAETKSIDTGGEYVDDLYSKQYGSLSSFTKFDVSGNKTFENDGIDFIKLFKTWNKGEDTLPYTLTELDLSNTKNSNVTRFNLNLRDDRVGLNGAGYYRNPFENLTDINIVNSCVTTVVLPKDIALNTLQIAGSAIQNVDLDGQSILKTVDFSNCIALNQVTLNNCSAFETFNLSGTPLLNTVRITKCPVMSDVNIDMNGYDTPINVFIDEVPELKRINIHNVRNTESTITINASGLEELSLEGCEFSSIVLSSSCKLTIKSLDLSNSLVNIVDWDGTFISNGGDYLDLYNCDYLVQGGINITNNTAIRKVQLPNEENNPVNLNFSFSGCVNLERIYGNLNINRPGLFSNCTKFKIHDGWFNGRSTKNGNKQYYLADDSISGEAWADIFQRGTEVTNLTFDIANPTSCFSNTAVDAFDVYYVLRHLGPKVTNISGMFSNCPNIQMKIYSTSIDNSPHWTMFEKWGANLTNISSLFYNCTNFGPFRLYGNHSDEENGHIGLFTPLVNCTNFDNVFGLPNNSCIDFISDKNAFKLNIGQFFGGEGETVSFSHFKPRDVFDNLNAMTTTQVYRAWNSPTDSSIRNFERGNIKGLFSGISRFPSSLSFVLNSLRYLNFGTNTDGDFSNTMDKIPLEVTSISNCFNASSTIGNVSLHRLFTKNEDNEYDVITVSNCFDGSSDATWYLDNNTLSGFTKLKTFSSVFSGINKLIAGDEFPYDIFDPCADTITDLSGFFSGIGSQGTISQIDLPGRLFLKCENLQNISSCFSYFGIPFNPTPNGFINCKKLSNVSYLFYETRSAQRCLPNNFFNVGFIDNYVSITGADINEQIINIPADASKGWSGTEYVVTVTSGNTMTVTRYRNVTVDEQNLIIKCNPISLHAIKTSVYNGSSWVDESSSDYQPIKEYDSWNPRTITVLQHTPRKTISNMTNLFVRSSFTAYRHTLNLDSYTIGGDVEPNPDYCPFDYIYKDGSWTTCSRNEKEFTFMWAFDGLWDESIKQIDMSNYLLDDEAPYDVKNSNNSATQLFWCPPDLLRWCTVNPNIALLFWQSNYYGRIPAYLLKPTPNIKSISGLFGTCSRITAYSVVNNGSYKTIPDSFFTYTPQLSDLSNAFSQCVFYSNPDVFGSLKEFLNVASIFNATIWSGGTSTNKFQLSGVFAGNKISNCASAFNGSYSDDSRNQYIQFNDMFSTDKAIHPESADDKVFYGYTSANYVTHEARPTCSTLAAKKNYAFNGQ